MIIESNLLAITNAMFKDKHNWKWVTYSQKEEFFFIINRLMTKRFPHQAQLLNHKSINKVVGLDLWFELMKSHPYPKWIWSKSESEKRAISQSDYKLLIEKLCVKDLDLDYLIEFHIDFINEELKFYKKLEKQ